jgi:hypothetical protein
MQLLMHNRDVHMRPAHEPSYCCLLTLIIEQQYEIIYEQYRYRWLKLSCILCIYNKENIS